MKSLLCACVLLLGTAAFAADDPCSFELRFDESSLIDPIPRLRIMGAKLTADDLKSMIEGPTAHFEKEDHPSGVVGNIFARTTNTGNVFKTRVIVQDETKRGARVYRVLEFGPAPVNYQVELETYREELESTMSEPAPYWLKDILNVIRMGEPKPVRKDALIEAIVARTGKFAGQSFFIKDKDLLTEQVMLNYGPSDLRALLEEDVVGGLTLDLDDAYRMRWPVSGAGEKFVTGLLGDRPIALTIRATSPTTFEITKIGPIDIAMVQAYFKKKRY